MYAIQVGISRYAALGLHWREGKLLASEVPDDEGNITFTDTAFAGETRIEFQESDGSSCFAEWFDLEELDLLGGPRLYPDGLKALLGGLP
ncbi:MAG: hypothetical protein HWD84_04330 [Flavobacteriaceae bacterium]|nr:hypothetical protein [Flavobacteriaceae bacterium]